MNDIPSDLFEHPVDVLRAAIECANSNKHCALAIVTSTVGGAVRDRGALMMIDEGGRTFGYLSGGCIDSDVALRAKQAMDKSAAVDLTYGTGSPFIDIRLPCGGAITLKIVPHPDVDKMRTIVNSLDARRPIYAQLIHGHLQSTDASLEAFLYRPKLKLRLVGKGTDLRAMATIAHASGYEVEVWSPDIECLEAFHSSESIRAVKLDSPAHLPSLDDDAHTAFVLMFHDVDWETALLSHALEGNAFYVGAVGSRETQKRRIEALEKSGLSSDAIARVRGPIGLVPSMRDASMLAISVLSEVVACFQHGASS